MRRKTIFLPLATLLLLSLACGIDINLPYTKVKTGPTVTEPIQVPLSTSKSVDVSLSLGGGSLTINPGSDEALITGTVTYNVEDFKPEVSVSEDSVTIIQGDFDFNGIPKFDEKLVNDWDLKIAPTPLTLRIQAGAYVGHYELGGLSLENLHIEDGASDVELSFSEPNQVEMGLLDYQTGASSATLKNLGNANFSTLVFKSGAGSYTLDFSGELQRDATVKIESGLSSFRLIVPSGVPARVTFDGVLTNVSLNGNWEKSGDAYTQPGSGPGLSITIEMGGGNLELRNTP